MTKDVRGYVRARVIGGGKLVAGVVAGFFVIVALSATVGMHIYRQRTTLNSHTVSLKAQLTLLPGGDANNNGKIDGGDAVHVSFTLTNKGRAAAKFMTLQTHIDKTKLFFIRNVHGASSITMGGSSITIGNISILPHQTQMISFDANALYGTKDLQLSYKPQLVGEQNMLITVGNQVNETIVHNNKTVIPSMVVITGKEQ